MSKRNHSKSLKTVCGSLPNTTFKKMLHFALFQLQCDLLCKLFFKAANKQNYCQEHYDI